MTSTGCRVKKPSAKSASSTGVASPSHAIDVGLRAAHPCRHEPHELVPRRREPDRLGRRPRRSSSPSSVVSRTPGAPASMSIDGHAALRALRADAHRERVAIAGHPERVADVVLVGHDVEGQRGERRHVVVALDGERAPGVEHDVDRLVAVPGDLGRRSTPRTHPSGGAARRGPPRRPSGAPTRSFTDHFGQHGTSVASRASSSGRVERVDPRAGRLVGLGLLVDRRHGRHVLLRRQELAEPARRREDADERHVAR